MSYKSLLKQSITLEDVATGRSKTGTPNLSTGRTLRARVQPVNKTIVTKERDKTPIHAIVFLDKAAAPILGSRLTYDGTAYRVLVIEKVPGRNGQIHHFELMVQLWSFES